MRSVLRQAVGSLTRSGRCRTFESFLLLSHFCFSTSPPEFGAAGSQADWALAAAIASFGMYARAAGKINSNILCNAAFLFLLFSLSRTLFITFSISSGNGSCLTRATNHSSHSLHAARHGCTKAGRPPHCPPPVPCPYGQHMLT